MTVCCWRVGETKWSERPNEGFACRSQERSKEEGCRRRKFLREGQGFCRECLGRASLGRVTPFNSNSVCDGVVLTKLLFF